MSVSRAAVGTSLGAGASHFREHWVAYFIEGIILTIAGLVAIVVPPLATLALTLFLGWLFVITGVVGIVASLRMRHAPGFGWSLLSAVLAIAVGVLLLWSPIEGAATLTLVLAAFFIVDGIASIMFAMQHRHDASGRWGWILASGIVTLVLAAVILAGFPGTVAWTLGLLVGIDLVFSGSALAAVALAARARG